MTIDSNTCGNEVFNSLHKWKIGNVIRYILVNDDDLKPLLGSKVYPLIAPENTQGDFILYRREQYQKSWAKQGVYEDSCQVAVTIVSDNYDKAIDIAEKVDKALVGRHIVDDSKIQIDLVDSTESFEDLKYIEVLLLSIK